MKNAIELNENLKNILVFECQFNESLNFKLLADLVDVSKYYSFEYKEDTIKVFRFYQIGDGMVIKINDLLKNEISLKEIKELVAKAHLKIISRSNTQLNKPSNTNSNKKSIFKCNFGNCHNIFYSQIDYQDHIDNHEEFKLPQQDKAIILYSNKCSDLRIDKKTERNNSKLYILASKENSNCLSMGYAVKIRLNKHFNYEQKKYLQDKFMHGVDTGLKFSAKSVENEMNDLFEKDLRLSEKQIKSYFSILNTKFKNNIPFERISKEKKKTTKKIAQKEDSTDDSEHDEDLNIQKAQDNYNLRLRQRKIIENYFEEEDI